MRYVLLALGLVCLFYGTSIYFVYSGTLFFVAWFVIGIALLLWGLAIGTGLWKAVPIAVRTGAWIVAAVALVGYVSLSAAIMAESLASPPDDLDYLIVLGSQVKRTGPAVVTQYRLDRAYDYLVEHPDTICVVTGGQGPNEPFPEGDGMGRYLEDRGIPTTRLMRERVSTSTIENIGNAWAMIDDKDARVGIVTNDFHVYRSVRIAKRLGIEEAYGVSAGSVPWYLPNNLLRECLGIVKDLACDNMVP